MSLIVNHIQAKSVLVKTALPGADWVVNPYRGCTFGCLYCYAAQIARWQHPGEAWGSYLDVKKNSPELLAAELKKLEKKFGKKDFGFIFFSSVTDPYVGLESKYQITRQCLQTLVDFGYQGDIGIQTKSPLVTCDIDLLKKLKKVSVGLTVTSLDDRVSRFLEVNAPPVSSRLKALAKLHAEGIPTYAFVGPILPTFVMVSFHPRGSRMDSPGVDVFNELLDKLKQVGVTEVWFEHLNLSPKIKARLFTYLKRTAPELIPIFERANTLDYRETLESVIKKCLHGRKMKMGLGQVIHHQKLPEKLLS